MKHRARLDRLARRCAARPENKYTLADALREAEALKDVPPVEPTPFTTEEWADLERRARRGDQRAQLTVLICEHLRPGQSGGPAADGRV